MKLRCLATSLFALVAACARSPLPPLVSLPAAAEADAAARCQQAFPPQPWRATHTILATLPLGYNGALLGVLAATAEGLHAVLLSPEGITLFEAVHKRGGSGGLAIQRAVPPFDRSDFALALLADVGAAFLPPAGEPEDIGRAAGGATVCRWAPTRHEATEVELGQSGPARIRTFRGANVTRRIELAGVPQGGFFPHVRLTVPGAGGYTLDMQLVDRE
ncbi:MAG: hypothetical protein JXP73_08335 [Deltaproteobacteria bacterium]|jgi:hypothetical protein|nr:hypothetical protein [Deltaproteobacteria bacterium]